MNALKHFTVAWIIRHTWLYIYIVLFSPPSALSGQICVHALCGTLTFDVG